MSGRAAITHEDSAGHKGRTEAGDVQVMKRWLRDGVRALRQYNLEAGPWTTLFQSFAGGGDGRSDPRHGWPLGLGAAPSFLVPEGEQVGQRLRVRPNRRSGTVFAEDWRRWQSLPDRLDQTLLHSVSGATLKAGETTEYALGKGRHAYLWCLPRRLPSN